MDIHEMEQQAKEAARKRVAGLLQRPDQLEKTEQIRKRVTQKKGSVEAMIKTAVQSQLDGVRTGLNQLQSALQDIKYIHKSLKEIDSSYSSISHLKDKLKAVREENSRHSQLAAAVENLKHIFNVPENSKKTEEYITDGKLLLAHKHLMELDESRMDLLYELHRQQQQGSESDRQTILLYFDEVDELFESLAKQLWLILNRALMSVRREPAVIVTVLRIIEREERIDSIVQKRQEISGFNPPGRPKSWRSKAFTVLQDSVSSRVEGCQMEDRNTNKKMWLVRHLEVLRQLTLSDLRIVKTLFESCFPPYYNITQKYIEFYNTAMSHHISDLTSQGLEGNEIVTLLSWIQEYSGPELMGSTDLSIDVSKLSPLLQPDQIKQLQNQYIQTIRGNFQEWMRNSLFSDIKDWFRDVPPDADEKGFYNTQMPVILFQMIEQNLEVASTVNENLLTRVLAVCVDQLVEFSKTYREELIKFKNKHFENRSEPQFFLHYMIANVNNCYTLADITGHIKKRFTKGISESSLLKISRVFTANANEGCDYLLMEVFMDLEAHTQQLLTKKWLETTSNSIADIICVTLEDYCQDFVHLRNKYFQTVLDKAQERVVTDYLCAIFSRKISFRDYQDRVKVAEKIVRESEQFQRLFEKLAIKAVNSSPFEALPHLVEVIKMKDTSMMSLEISGLIKRYPDIKTDQLVSLLLIRGDIGKSDARQMVQDIVGEDYNPKGSGLFSNLSN